MSRNLIQWLRRTRMTKSMIWKTYFKHRRQELRERFPQCRRSGTSTNFMTYLQIRTNLGDGLYYCIFSEDKHTYIPIDTYDFFSHYYVEKICFEFQDDGLTTYVIKCYCRKQLCSNPIVEIPRLDFLISIKYWSPKEACDFIEILPQFFDKWRKELWTLYLEISKIMKMREMKMLRSELLGMRKIESYVESRYMGFCEKNEEEVSVTVALSDGHDLTITSQFVYYYPNWWERTLEIVDAFVAYFECQIKDNGLNRLSIPCKLNCFDGQQWFDSFTYQDLPEDLVALTASKKKWRKWMPMVVEIA